MTKLEDKIFHDFHGVKLVQINSQKENQLEGGENVKD